MNKNTYVRDRDLTDELLNVLYKTPEEYSFDNSIEFQFKDNISGEIIKNYQYKIVEPITINNNKK